MTTPRNWQIDKRLLEYADALETHDWVTFSEIWNEALTNAELEQALREYHEGLIEEQNAPAGLEDDAEAVRQVIAACFPERPVPPDETQKPLSASDVASRLQADLAAGSVRLTEDDRQTNQLLLMNATALPEQLKLPVFEKWCQELGIEASLSYWRIFRQTALKLNMSRSQQQARLLAAREQNPKPKGDAPSG